MLIEYLINFVILVSAQLALFLIHAYTVGEMHNVKNYLLKGMLVGLIFGVTFDLLVGKVAGMFDYRIGFKLWFLALNGMLSYGLMVANLLLIYRRSLKYIYLWSVGIGITYEMINLFFPIWEWTFPTTQTTEYLTIIFLAYTTFSIVLALGFRFSYRRYFNFSHKI